MDVIRLVYSLPDWLFSCLIGLAAVMGLFLITLFVHPVISQEYRQLKKSILIICRYATIILLFVSFVDFPILQETSIHRAFNRLVHHFSEEAFAASETSSLDKALSRGSTLVHEPTSSANQIIEIPSSLGMNISRVIDYATQWMFVDMMKQARPWITQESGPWYSGKAWDSGLRESIPIDENGYPLEIPFAVNGIDIPQRVLTIIGNSSYPDGEYLFLAEGDGDISFSGSGITFRKNPEIPVTDATISYIVNFAPGHSYVIMGVDRSNPQNHLRNMRFIKRDFLDTYQTQPFHPEFIKHLQGFKVLRYMEYLMTNSNPTTFELNIPSTYYTQAVKRGGSIDYIAELSNQTFTDPWITIPHNANDEYIEDVAIRLKTRLHSNRKIYIEYSNELWNSLFKQTEWVYKTACGLPTTYVSHTTGNDWGFKGCDDLASSVRYQAMRITRIYSIFNTVFGNTFTQRIVKIASSQAANAYLSDKLLAAFDDKYLNSRGYKPDALAIAPYFGEPIANKVFHNKESSSIATENIIAMTHNDMQSNSFRWMQAQKKVASNYKVNLVAYEGGQHLVGNGGAENDTSLTQKLIDTNRNPAMQDLYEHYLDYWFHQTGGGLFVLFNNVEEPSKWGSWGLYEFQTQPIEESPKAMAVNNLIAKLKSTH